MTQQPQTINLSIHYKVTGDDSQFMRHELERAIRDAVPKLLDSGQVRRDKARGWDDYFVFLTTEINHQ